MSKVKRSQIATYVDTATTTGPVWSLLGVGVTTGKTNMNPKTTEETYIHQDTATISVDSYAPTMPVEMTPDTTNAVFTYVDTLRKTRATASDAETEIVEVDLYATGTTGGYPARRQAVAISIDDWGGDGGVPAKINFTFNYQGTTTSGVFNNTSAIFTAS